MAFNSNPPLGLYIHLPWCEKKCPYCDFNSHSGNEIPEQQYIAALLNDLEQDLPLIWGRSVESIFIGGGTPSLFSGQAIDQLFSGLRALLNINPGIEVTMESNPGSADIENYRAYRDCGVNRLSIGIQSFNDEFLTAIGRIHSAELALQAFESARQAGFNNINIDLMYGLPAQSLMQSNADVQQAIELGPEHISHYQLTIEDNTLFRHQPPAYLPDDDLSWAQQCQGQTLMAAAGYRQYEISAYSLANEQCQHNLNYWHFGDYLGIGAGAHGKITLAGENRIIRRVRQRQPQAYLKTQGRASIVSENQLDVADLVFEFMLNSLRLTAGFKSTLFTENTGLSLSEVLPTLQLARESGLLNMDQTRIFPTQHGLRFLNDLQSMFLDHKSSENQAFFDTSNEIIHS
ncbi:MAG: oxygen-independent coproporphyrinogen III oxidase-like protein [Gammaproteobacteria bacterium]|nr:oxygen-independent coproporphyrinogen III oxidase-like protein [Gammaproteobacteria bacterium]